MEPQRRASEPARNQGVPLPAKVAVGALAVWAGITLLQWVISGALQFIRLGLTVVIIVALAGWVLSAKANR